MQVDHDEALSDWAGVEPPEIPLRSPLIPTFSRREKATPPARRRLVACLRRGNRPTRAWEPATELAGAFLRLHEHGVLREDTAKALGRAAGLRNVVARVYAVADPLLVWTAATIGLEDLESFAAEIAVWFTASRTGHS